MSSSEQQQQQQGTELLVLAAATGLEAGSVPEKTVGRGVAVSRKDSTTTTRLGFEESKRDTSEYLDAVLPIARPMIEPGLTCSGLDTGIDEIEDIVFEGGVVVPSKSFDNSGNAGGEKSVVPPTSTPPAEEAVPAMEVPPCDNQQQLQLKAAVVGEKKSLTAAEVVDDNNNNNNNTYDNNKNKDGEHVVQVISVTTAACESPVIPVTTTVGENEQTITIEGVVLAQAQSQPQQQVESEIQELEYQVPVAVAPKKAPKSCVVNMASDDEQSKGQDESQVEKEKNSTCGEQEAAGEAVKVPVKRGRKPGKKAAEVKESAKSRLKESKPAQVTFDLTSQPFTDAQQVQLRAQILVYGAVIQGLLPEESLMGAAFIDISKVSGIESFESQLTSSKSVWEKAWKATSERIQKAMASLSGSPTLPSSPTAKTAKAKLIKCNKAATTPAPPSSDFSSVLNMASATISSWNSARNRQFPQMIFNGPWGIPAHFQSPLHGSWNALSQQVAFGNSFAPQAPSAAVDERNKGTKRKRKDQVSSEPSTPFTQQLAANDISPATAGLLEDVPVQRAGENGIVSPGELEKFVGTEELVQRLKSAKQKAEEAASAAASVVEHSQTVWDEVKEKRRNNIISSKEAQLASSFAAVTAAASVAKAAAAAANVAYAAALQAKAMANDLVLTKTTTVDNDDPTVTHVTQADERYKALLSSTRNEVKEQVQTASFALTRAENLDAVIRAAELAAEAASQAGTVMSIGDPSTLALPDVEIPKAKVSGRRNARSKPAAGKKKEEASKDQSSEQAEEVPSTETDNEKTEALTEVPVKTVELVDTEREPSEGMVEDKLQTRTGQIVVGSHVEIVPDEEGLEGVWFSAKIMSFNGDQALVVYDELLDDDGNGKLEEWVDITSQIDNIPRVRIAHPMTKDGGMRKRRRASLGNQIWMKDDHVDVWIRDGWWEGIVQSVDEDESLVTVYFPGDGDTEVTKSWNLRPSLVWQDDSWIFWRDLHPERKQDVEDGGRSLDSQRAQESFDIPSGKKKPATSTPESSKVKTKPTKRRKFSDVIEKDQEARKQQQQQANKKSDKSKPKKATSPRSSNRRGPSLPGWKSKGPKKRKASSSEATSDVSKEAEVRKSGRMIHPTSKLLEGMETTLKTGKKIQAMAVAS